MNVTDTQAIQLQGMSEMNKTIKALYKIDIDLHAFKLLEKNHVKKKQSSHVHIESGRSFYPI